MATGVLSSVSISNTSCNNESSDLTWNTDMEVNLFHAMRGHKPAGVNKHFQMIAIHERLSSASKKLTSEDVWQHLSTLYDLQALNESEIVPFPNKSSNFDLPEVDVTELGEKKFPRTPYLDSQSTPPDHTRTAEGLSTPSSKNAIKLGKQEVKTPVTPVAKAEVKPEVKASSSVKSDSRSSTPSSSRGDNKEHKNTSSNSSKTPQQLASASSSEPSPKRMKRTRTVPSASASPATPNESASKRRR